jgi:tRNA pseudouridine55 synthase
MAAGRRSWQRVDAVLLLDKPIGPSSNAALQRARRVYSAARAGHAGTLDPMASGLLPVAFGEATKFLHDLLDADKTYEAVLQLGIRTDSGDAEGVELQRHPLQAGQPTDAAIEAACAAFQGPIEQIPPMHSALKRDGKPLYAYAREGVDLERAPRAVTIHEIAVTAIDRSNAAHPTVALRVSVSKGTYIRTLAEDIGARLGCGAHLVALRRTRVGPLSLDDSVALDQLETVEVNQRVQYLRPVDLLVSTLPRIALEPAIADRFVQGQRIVLDPAQRVPLARTEPGAVRVYRGEQLLGIAQFAPPGLLAPSRVLAAAAP